MENAQATIFRLLQKEQFAEEMKSLKIEEEISKKSKFLYFHFFDKRDLFVRKAKYEKNQSEFSAKHQILIRCKHHVVEFFLRNEHK